VVQVRGHRRSVSLASAAEARLSLMVRSVPREHAQPRSMPSDVVPTGSPARRATAGARGRVMSELGVQSMLDSPGSALLDRRRTAAGAAAAPPRPVTPLRIPAAVEPPSYPPLVRGPAVSATDPLPPVDFGLRSAVSAVVAAQRLALAGSAPATAPSLGLTPSPLAALGVHAPVTDGPSPIVLRSGVSLAGDAPLSSRRSPSSVAAAVAAAFDESSVHINVSSEEELHSAASGPGSGDSFVTASQRTSDEFLSVADDGACGAHGVWIDSRRRGAEPVEDADDVFQDADSEPGGDSDGSELPMDDIDVVHGSPASSVGPSDAAEAAVSARPHVTLTRLYSETWSRSAAAGIRSPVGAIRRYLRTFRSGSVDLGSAPLQPQMPGETPPLSEAEPGPELALYRTRRLRAAAHPLLPDTDVRQYRFYAQVPGPPTAEDDAALLALARPTAADGIDPDHAPSTKLVIEPGRVVRLLATPVSVQVCVTQVCTERRRTHRCSDRAKARGGMVASVSVVGFAAGRRSGVAGGTHGRQRGCIHSPADRGSGARL
jgi:hypothetical protein